MTGKEMENLTNKPILKRGENPSVVLHEFVKQNFKEEMKVDIVYLSNFYYYSKIKVRITLPNGIFWEEDGRNKKTAKRKAAQYIIYNWESLKTTDYWMPKEGFWSINNHLTLQSNRVGSGMYNYLIANNNCFINKSVAYRVADKLKELFSEYSPKNNNWEPEDGETYYKIGNLETLDIWKSTHRVDFWEDEYQKINKFKDEETAREVLNKVRKIFKEGRDLSTELWKEGENCIEIDCYHKSAQERAEIKAIIKSLQ